MEEGWEEAEDREPIFASDWANALALASIWAWSPLLVGAGLFYLFEMI